jgi:predicted GIY-YIG superfamily endonuclease
MSSSVVIQDTTARRLDTQQSTEQVHLLVRHQRSLGQHSPNDDSEQAIIREKSFRMKPRELTNEYILQSNSTSRNWQNNTTSKIRTQNRIPDTGAPNSTATNPSLLRDTNFS